MFVSCRLYHPLPTSLKEDLIAAFSATHHVSCSTSSKAGAEQRRGTQAQSLVDLLLKTLMAAMRHVYYKPVPHVAQEPHLPPRPPSGSKS